MSNISKIETFINSNIMDNEKQINLPLLSETYKLTFEECSNLLEQWSGKNEVKLSKLFLTQYVEKECLYVKMIPENKIQKLESEHYTQSLYKVSPTKKNKKNDFLEIFDNVIINLTNESTSRNLNSKPTINGENDGAMGKTFDKLKKTDRLKPPTIKEQIFKNDDENTKKSPNKSSSIASFFTSGKSNEDKETTKAGTENLTAKNETINIEIPASKNINQSTKNLKMPSKKSRIMQIAHSSSESEEEPNNVKDIEENNVPNSSSGNLGFKQKARRATNKTYLDADGFVVTKREIEEYTTSEEEKDPSKEAEKGKPTEIDEGRKLKQEAKKLKTKQGSLLLFFSKK